MALSDNLSDICEASLDEINETMESETKKIPNKTEGLFNRYLIASPREANMVMNNFDSMFIKLTRPDGRPKRRQRLPSDHDIGGMLFTTNV